MRHRRLIACLPTLVLAGLIPFASAHAQMISSREGIALENQILELRQQVQALQQNGSGNSVLAPSQPQSSGSSQASSALLPNLLQQVQTLEDQVQSLRGRVDTLEHEVAAQNGQINQELGDLKFKLDQGGQGTGGAAPQNGAPPSAGGTLGTIPAQRPVTSGQASGQQAAAAAPARPVASITAARRALAARDYRGAEADARAVIARQGKKAGDGEAELTLGEALAGQGNHQAAAIAYDDAYNVNHAGPHAPYALLGLASSLSALHRNQEACDVLGSIQHPASASFTTQLSDARRRAHCS
ncbi:MAG TPA: hypothetical protein VF286_09030 [Acidiphilium sp.]